MAEDDRTADEDKEDQNQYGGDPEAESAVEQTQRRTDDDGDEDDEGVEGDQGRDADEDEGEYGQDETDPE